MNSTDSMKQTALHWAAVRGSIAVADVLLQNGARVEAADAHGFRVTICIFPLFQFYRNVVAFSNILSMRYQYVLMREHIFSDSYLR